MNIFDGPEFANEFGGAARKCLVDLNGDGTVNIFDGPTFSHNFQGNLGLPKAQDTTLPPKPDCP